MIVCPKCYGEPAQPVLVHHNTGPDSRGHYWAERIIECRCCDGTGKVTPERAESYHAGRQHRADRIARRESLWEASKRLDCGTAALSAWELYGVPLPAQGDRHADPS